ncbi:nitroreductase [Streptosporangium fragile]|uniref:Nitroreductase n=1 Tax=Streptosporangium fragile TaxID=46186 RepID=A0ABN3VS11_9ACTN
MSSPLATDLGVRRLLTAAGQAPSVHNTQPWRFRVVGREAIELLADRDRWLRVSDPRGRSLRVSCGAALFNLRLAVRVAGWEPLTRLLPSPQERPDLLATVRVPRASRPSRAERDLYSFIGVRRTNRYPYEDRSVPGEVLDDLRTAASAEGAALFTTDPADLLDYVAIAEERLAADRGYRAELAAWTMPKARHDGVPGYVQGPRGAKDPSPTRDFGRHEHTARFEPHPQLAVLATPGDGPRDWLRAGQALQRVLLTATMHGVSASFLNQPLDLRDILRRTDPRHPLGHPQMIIRFGYGPSVPRAPRRPATELEITSA